MSEKPEYHTTWELHLVRHVDLDFVDPTKVIGQYDNNPVVGTVWTDDLAKTLEVMITEKVLRVNSDSYIVAVNRSKPDETYRDYTETKKERKWLFFQETWFRHISVTEHPVRIYRAGHMYNDLKKVIQPAAILVELTTYSTTTYSGWLKV